MTDRDTSGFTRASHQSQALCLATMGLGGVLMPIAVWGFPSLGRFSAGALAAAAGALLLHRARFHWRRHAADLGAGYDGSRNLALGADIGIPAGNAAHLYAHGQLHPDVARLVKVANAKFPGKLTLDLEATELEDDGKGGRKLVAWGFRCVDSGFLTDEGTSTRLQNTFRKALGGLWSPLVDSRNDTFGGTRRSAIPKLVFPPNWPVVRDAEEAKTRYPGWAVEMGVGADGPVGVLMESMPHIRVIGGTGEGKSTALRSWLEQFRAAGWMLILADGKGPDYVGYTAPDRDNHGLPVPGTVAVGLGSAPRGMSYVAAIALAYQILTERQEESTQLKIDNSANWNSYIPVLLVLDEIKAMRGKWRTSLSKEDVRDVESVVEQLTALGREYRVHVIVVSQDARDDSVPGKWSSNIPVTVSLGKPKDMTMKKGFEDSVLPKVRLIRESMDPHVKGRCLIATVDKELGVADAVEYQGFLSYSPGEHMSNIKLPPQVKDRWPEFKAKVSDRVPRLYTRQWFKIDKPSAAQSAAEKKSGQLRGFIDFDLFTTAEILEMERVALDRRCDNGEIIPDPAMAKYDPASVRYVCNPPASTRKTVRAEL